MGKATEQESKTAAGVRDLALSYLGQGRTDTAEKLLRELLALHPDDVQGLRLLALILQSQQRSDEAIAALLKASSLAPDAAHVHADLAALYRSLSRPAEAEVAMRAALRIEPSMSAGWRLLADVLVDLDRLPEAGQAYERAKQCDPFRPELARAGEHLARQEPQQAEQVFREILRREGKHPGALCGLAAVALLTKQPAQAERLLKVALRQSPHSPLIWRSMAQASMESGRLQEAEDAIRRALRVEPGSAQHWVMLGTILARRLRQEQALAAYEEALEREPRQRVRVLMSMGHLYKTLGRRGECEATYRAALDLEPGNGELWWSLADLKNYRFCDAEVGRMEAALAVAGADPANAALLNFALGRAREQRAAYADAFGHYARANALRRRSVQFDAAAFESKSRRIIDFFSAAVLASCEVRAPASPASTVPLFIVGLPRSGSTLVEQILASHPQVEGTMELHTLIDIVEGIDHGGGRRDAYPEALAQLDAGQLAAMGERYLRDTAQFRTGKPCFIDKMPNNFRHIGLARMILPQARFIDVRRHPMDACFSTFKQYFAAGQSFSYDLEDLGRYYRVYLAMMRHWHRVLPGQVLTLHYERLVRDTEGEVRRALEFCGLEFDPACLRFHENRRAVRTASAEQVRQPIFDSGVDHWKHFELQLEPLRRALGDAFSTYEA